MVNFIVFLFIWSFGDSTLAKTQEPKPEIKLTMQSFLISMKELKPFMLSYDHFAAPENKTDLVKKINTFAKLAATGEALDLQTKPGFNVTYNLLGKHLKEIEHLYSAGATESAWHRLNATGHFCIGCHSRFPGPISSLNYSWPDVDSAGRLEKPEFKEAEFLFFSHQYQKSLEILNRLISSHSDPKQIGELPQIFERKIFYFARIQRDPKAAIDSLNKDLKNPNLPTEIKDRIKTWIPAFTRLGQEVKKFPKQPSDQVLLSKAKTLILKQKSELKVDLGDPQTISILWISGLLYERVLKGDTSAEMPDFLYLLAKVERAFQSIRIYSLADIYLKQCVELFPKSPIARTCFNDYSVSMKQKYHLRPETIQNSIDSLGDLLK